MTNDTAAPSDQAVSAVAKAASQAPSSTLQTRSESELASAVTSTPIGPLLIATTEHGVVRVAFAAEGIEPVIGELIERLRPRHVLIDDALTRHAAQSHLLKAQAQLSEYFAGRLRRFTVPIDDALSRGFYLEVRQALREVPYGTTTTYTALAEQLNRPKAVRAVGTGCSGNPIPVIVPCHRITRADGTLGGYRGGAPAKAILQSLEARTLHP